MDNQANEFWNKVSPGLRQYRNLTPPTSEQAEAGLRAAASDPLPEERLQDILAFALTGKKKKQQRTLILPDWLKNIDLGTVNKEMVFSLARNAGATDAEVEQQLDLLRREALEQDTSNGEQET